MYCLRVTVLVDDATISVQDEQNVYRLGVVLEPTCRGQFDFVVMPATLRYAEGNSGFGFLHYGRNEVVRVEEYWRPKAFRVGTRLFPG
jgi:hypothetical protein